ncbi:Uncharacterized protein TCAP_00065 [Tolypocladium capitatum]|uniref:Uncharacterized protein n=1 Tax=Tolypocladium capitatum TaxID=45235 RepID=A0A2K3QR20_9HYPO|nr:Uncharacterized protein TCAP_00065 [Tolypocladium capitatum]
MPEVQVPLSRPNSNRLQQLGLLAGDEGQPPSPAQRLGLDDAVQRLSSAPDERSRYDAVLQLFASLSCQQRTPETAPGPPSSQRHEQHQRQRRHLSPAAASTVTQSLVASVLSLDRVADYTARALTAELALTCLDLLSTASSAPLDDQALLSIVSYTDVRDPWTTHAASRLAARLVSSHLPADRPASFIVGPLLQAYVRPVFSGSSDKVTSSGRPVQFHGRLSSPRKLGMDNMPCWKQSDPPVTSVFRWAVENASTSLIAENWPLFLPVLLVLVEDHETHVREKGLATLATFLSKCTLKTLRATGIGNLFEEAVFPMLLFLPNLTPEQDSANLLRLAYPVLLQLAEADPDPQSHKRRRLLDRLVRDGIMAGYSHASQHATIVQVLMHNMAAAVSCLGIFSVKHLQNLLRMIESVMTDPFAIACPSTVLAAAEALDALLSHCWPRITETKHAGHILRIITICWLNLHDQEDDTDQAATTSGRDRIFKQLLVSSRLFKFIWAGPNLEMQHKLAEALSQEPRLAPLFLEYASPPSISECRALARE